MRRHRAVSLLLAAGVPLLPSAVRGQSEALSLDAPKLGLALSGGAARGMAHIGVLKVLEDAGISLDVVAGTSAGSIVGGLYAAGYTAAMVEDTALAQDWELLISDAIRRRDVPIERRSANDRYLFTLPIARGRVRLPRSLVAGQRFSQVLTRLTWPVHSVRDFRVLPIPFAAVGTDVETGEAVVLDHGFLADAIRASMAIPSVFAPMEIEGRVLIDGGVVRNLPAQDARALGADLLICSDVTDPLEPRDSLASFLDILIQSVSFRVWDSEAAERKLCDVLIEPDVKEFGTFAFDRIREIVGRGEAAARASLPQLEALLSRAPRSPAARPPLVAPESLLIDTVHFEGLVATPPGFLRRVFGVQPGRWVTPRRLDEAVDRVYATGLFQSVRYRLGPSPDGAPERTELTLLLEEGSASRFGLGYRYDSRYKASVLVAATLADVAGFGSTGHLDLRLGQQIQLGLGVTQAVGSRRTFRVGARADYARSPFDLYAAGRRVAEARVDLGAISGSLARALGNSVQVSARVKLEHARWDDAVSAVDVAAIHRTFYSVAGVVEADTYDRGVFPTRGVGFHARSEWANRLVGGGGFFSQHVANVRGYLPVYRTVSLWGGATLGTSGGEPPPHYQFFLGGANSYYLFPDRSIAFAGLDTQERSGEHVQKFEAGARWEFVDDVFGGFRWNAGNVFNRWVFDPDRYVNGFGVELGARTLAGRLSLVVSGNSLSDWSNVELDVGFPF